MRLMKPSNSTSNAIADEANWGPILLVEDEAAYARVIKKRLEMNGYEVIVARDGVEALELSKQKHPDMVITDWMMPRMDGPTLCEQLRADPSLQAIYVILLSNKSGTEEKIQCLERGADDYLVKDCDSAELVARVQAGMRIRALQRALIRQANQDGLTNLFNRSHFYERLREELDRSNRYGMNLTLAMIDLDRLKQINDQMGHLEGDNAILRVASVIRSCTRATDVVARYGGDEFAVLFINADFDHAHSVMERVSKALQEFNGEDTCVPLGLSYGLATRTGEESSTPEEFIQEADARLYEMKRDHHALLSR